MYNRLQNILCVFLTFVSMNICNGFCLLLLCFILAGSGLKGQEKRNLLQKEIERAGMPAIRAISYPAYHDRAFWESIPQQLRESAVKKAGASMGEELKSVPLTAYLEFVRIGDRKNCDGMIGEQNRRLQNLVMGELLEGKGRFLDAIIDNAWALCERSTWVGTAHLASQKRRAGVPDIHDIIIDLSSGETSTLLAWTYYFFKDDFDKVSPLIAERIKYELNKRTFEPYVNRDDLWWMGFKGSFVNNWNVWCNYNVLMSALLVEQDSVARQRIVQKTMASVDQFINYYKNDGGCEEGPSYWDHAPGKLMEYLEALRNATGGKVDMFREPLIHRMGEYIAKAHIDSSWFVNFADASAKSNSLPTVIYSYGKNTGDPVLMSFGKYLGDLSGASKNPLQGSISMILTNLQLMDEFSRQEAKAPAFKSVWLDGIEVAAGRDKEGSNRGLYFAAKGGFNNESHNHNDVGNFILYKNGKPVIVDAGVGTYTAKTFSSKRYEIWTMQSAYHNLPVINGQQQAFGTKYCSSATRFADNGRSLVFSLDIAKAYPASADCKSWVRTYTFTRGSHLKVADSYRLGEMKGETELGFLTCCEVNKAKDGLLLLGTGDQQVRMEYDPRKMELAVEDVELDDPRLSKVWGKKLTRIVLKYKKTGLQGESVVLFR